jgi:hypothetical protein
MNFSIVSGTAFHIRLRTLKNGIAYPLFIFIFCFHAVDVKSQTCSACCLSAFPALTVYQSFQTSHGLGFGLEAGTWNKDAGKFSYFVGTSMVWNRTTGTIDKTNPNSTSSTSQMLLSFYVKGQYKLTKHLYVVASPGVVNLSYFDLQTGLRYVIPVSRVIGIGIEPAYSFNQKVVVLNANMHIALR